jgi:hypothetical protein
MTDKWFLQDIEHQLKSRKRMVISDPKGLCGFLLPLLEHKGYIILKTDPGLSERWQTVKEELLLRYEAENKYKDNEVVFYITREQSKLSFLMDYCFTHGLLDLSNPIDWLKKKIFANTALQIHQEPELLWVIAKEGIGKDVNWWKSIIQGLQDPIGLDEKLLPFLHDPEPFAKAMDKDIRQLFEIKVFGEILGQPYMSKPPKTIAGEVVKRIFDGLVFNDISDLLLNLYYRWADSEQYSSSLEDYIAKYKLEGSVNPWAAHPDHCFLALDRIGLAQISLNIKDKGYRTEKLGKIKVRANARKVKRFVPLWWNDVITIAECDTKPLAACNSLSMIITFYTEHFSKVDRAIRRLYGVFLNEKEIIRPIQEYYESLDHELLEHWFAHIKDYKTDQQGYLITLLKGAKPPVAVIVGDGLRYEIADYIACSLEKQFKVDKQVMLADLPSETEHNMSALYIGNNEVVPIHSDREKRLTEATGKKIDYLNLEALHYGVKADYLVLTYKDIDSAGETLQHGAIKLFDEFEQVLKEKITLLLNLGFSEVHLVTDHGFVLTGLLDESDKIEYLVKGKGKVSERYIRTTDKQDNDDLIGLEEPHGEYNYVYMSKSHRPFKSKGVYGFSHGGFTPQEVINPKFRFTKIKPQTSQLNVYISNKSDLNEVPGELFVIRLDAPLGPTDLFGGVRKVQIKLYAGNMEYQSSDIISIEANSIKDKEFSFNKNTQVQAVLIDASTHEQLDIVTINKSIIRDLGGL